MAACIFILNFIALLTMEHDCCSCDVCAVLREYPYDLPCIPVDLAASDNLLADAGSASISSATAASSNIIPAGPALAGFIPTDATSISFGLSGNSISASSLSIDGASIGALQTAPISGEIFLGDPSVSAQDPFLCYPDPIEVSPIVQTPQLLAGDEHNSNVQIPFDRAESYQYRCDICNKPQSDRGKLNRHKKGVHKYEEYKCQFCGHGFSRSDNRNAHEKSCRDNPCRESK
ncbi:hypothetical protein GGI42DRAFT_337630 [Trichoderma sp. SZMC 28013]